LSNHGTLDDLVKEVIRELTDDDSEDDLAILACAG
jgi:hypothetical protein